MKSNREELIGLINCAKDIFETDFGYGCSHLKVSYSYQGVKDTEVEVTFHDIVYLKTLTDVDDQNCALFIGESKFLNIEDFLSKSLDEETRSHITSRVESGDNLIYFWIEGAIYFEIICKKMTYSFFNDGKNIIKTIK